MIVVDIETSGLHPSKNGIWQIGAVDFANPDNTFIGECRIEDDDEVHEGALKVIGKTEEYLRDKTKKTQKELLEEFFEWAKDSHMKNFVCQNPQFDLGFLTRKARKFGVEYPFHFRAFDLHSIAATRYNDIHNKFHIMNGSSGMNLRAILEFCGMSDDRGAHNALEDAKLTAECLSRIVNGKYLLEEFKHLEVPEYLKKN